MTDKIRDELYLTIRIILNDEFKEEVTKYAERESFEDVNGEDLVYYLNDNIRPAKSKTSAFEIEGGDTDGWFIQGVNYD